MSLPPPEYSTRRSRGLLAQGFDNFLEREGNWLIHIGQDSRFNCTCFDPQTQEATSESCPSCFGMGHKPKPERLFGVIAAPGTVRSLVQNVQISSWGYADQYPGVAAVSRFYNLQKLDLVIEVEWNLPYESIANYGIPTKVAHVWRIDAVIPITFNNSGIVDFYMIGLEHHELKNSVFESYLKSSGSLISPPCREGLPPSQVNIFSSSASGPLGQRYKSNDSLSSYDRRGLGNISKNPPKGL